MNKVCAINMKLKWTTNHLHANDEELPEKDISLDLMCWFIIHLKFEMHDLRPRCMMKWLSDLEILF